MNELLEMLKMREELASLIEDATNELTVSEFVQLHESGILTENKLKSGYKAVVGLGKAAVGSRAGQAVRQFGTNVMGDKKNQNILKAAIEKGEKIKTFSGNKPATLIGGKRLKKIKSARRKAIARGDDAKSYELHGKERKKANGSVTRRNDAMSEARRAPSALKASELAVAQARKQAKIGASIGAAAAGGGYAANRALQPKPVPKTALQKLKERLGIQ